MGFSLGPFLEGYWDPQSMPKVLVPCIFRFQLVTVLFSFPDIIHMILNVRIGPRWFTVLSNTISRFN